MGGAKHRRYLGGMVVAHLWSVDKILGGDVGDAWRIVGSTNGGATNVLFFVVLVFVLMMVAGMGGAQCKKID